MCKKKSGNLLKEARMIHSEKKIGHFLIVPSNIILYSLSSLELLDRHIFQFGIYLLVDTQDMTINCSNGEPLVLVSGNFRIVLRFHYFRAHIVVKRIRI